MRRSPEFGKLRQKDQHEFQASLKCIARLYLKSLQNGIPKLGVVAYACMTGAGELPRVPQSETQTINK